MQNYYNLKIWKRAKDMTIQIYRTTTDYPDTEKYGLTSQMRRSSVSVVANIAEGSGRSTAKDFRKFLHISMGSINELSTYLIISLELGLISEKKMRELDNEVEQLKKMLYMFIKKIEKI